MSQHAGNKALVRSLTSMVAAGLTVATVAAVTAVIGWPGVLGGAAFTAMFTAAISTLYQANLDSAARVVLLADRPAPPPLVLLADRPAPPPLVPATGARGSSKHTRLSAALEWFSFGTTSERSRSILYRVLQAGVAAYLVGMGVVTAVEVGLGGNLSCYLWDADCSPTGSNPPSIIAPFYAIGCR